MLPSWGSVGGRSECLYNFYDYFVNSMIMLLYVWGVCVCVKSVNLFTGNALNTPQFLEPCLASFYFSVHWETQSLELDQDRLDL